MNASINQSINQSCSHGGILYLEILYSSELQYSIAPAIDWCFTVRLSLYFPFLSNCFILREPFFAGSSFRYLQSGSSSFRYHPLTSWLIPAHLWLNPGAVWTAEYNGLIDWLVHYSFIRNAHIILIWAISSFLRYYIETTLIYNNISCCWDYSASVVILRIKIETSHYYIISHSYRPFSSVAYKDVHTIDSVYK